MFVIKRQWNSKFCLHVANIIMPYNAFSVLSFSLEKSIFRFVHVQDPYNVDRNRFDCPQLRDFQEIIFGAFLFFGFKLYVVIRRCHVSIIYIMHLVFDLHYNLRLTNYQKKKKKIYYIDKKGNTQFILRFAVVIITNNSNNEWFNHNQPRNQRERGW